jgi:hypothetical protein
MMTPIAPASNDTRTAIVYLADGSVDWDRTPCPMCLRPCPKCVCGDECVCGVDGAHCAINHDR